MRALRGQQGGIGILLSMLLAALVLFVTYQVWIKGQRPPVPASQVPATLTGQVKIADQAPTTITESVSEAAPKPETPPSLPEQVQIPSPIIQAPLNSTERPVVAPPRYFTLPPQARQDAPLPVRPVQVPARPLPIKEVQKSDTFAESSRQIPILLVSQMAPNTLGMYTANPGALFMADMVVSHEPTGNGQVGTDGPYGQSVLASLHNAVQAASYAVGYDARFLRVRLIGRTMAGVAIQMEGPSAGAIMAVAVASALLGDSIRSDICMSGTIRGDLTVGRVGGLSDKISGCRQGNYRELIVPYGQTSMDLALKGMSTEIKITEVNTFAEAYEAATGQALRRL
ncbi:MAG: S16 family serine protease [Nitrospirota bacterium]